MDMKETALNDLWSFDITKRCWEEIQSTNSPPEERSFHKMICVGDALYVFGGCGSSGRLNDLHKFDLDSLTWTDLKSSHLLRGRGGANLMKMPGRNALAVVAGFAGEETNDGHIFDLEKGTWEEEGMEGLDSLRKRSVCVSGTLASSKQMFLYGGEVDPSDKGHDGAGGFEGDFVILDGDKGCLETVKCEEDWPEKRGWSDGDVLEVDDDSAAVFVFGGLAGNDENPRRLDDFWRCDVVNSK